MKDWKNLKCSTFLAKREIQIKGHRDFLLSPSGYPTPIEQMTVHPVKVWKKMDINSFLVSMQTVKTTIKNIVEAPQESEKDLPQNKELSILNIYPKYFAYYYKDIV